MHPIPSNFEPEVQRLLLTEVDYHIADLSGILIPLMFTLVWAGWLVHQVVPLGMLIGWLSAFLMVVFFREIGLRRFASQNEATRLRDLRKWLTRLGVFSAISGALWGLFAWVAIPTPELPLLSKVLVTFILVAYGALAAISIIPTDTFFLRLNLVVSIGPAVIAWIKVGGDDTQWMAIVMGLLILVYEGIGRRQLNNMRDRLRFATELARTNVLLEESNISRTRLLVEASHDLRQPVHALGMMLDRVKVSSSREELERRLNDMQVCVDTVADMLSNALDLSRLESGEYAANLQPVDLGRLLQEIDKVYRPLAQRKGLALIISRSSAWVVSDPVMLRRVLNNLISNAVKYTFVGCVGISCRIGVDRVRIKISDTGIGIPSDKWGMIFNEYVRLNDGRDEPGYGLGLAVVSRMVALLGHRLEMRSTVGKGSQFKLLLRRTQAPVAQPFSSSISESEEHRVDLRGKVILFIEDDDLLRRSTAEVLAADGARVVANSDVNKALKDPIFFQQAPDIVISDMHLGGDMDGLAVIETVRKKYPAILLPAILLTGDLRVNLQVEADAMDVRIVYKPARPSGLRQKVVCELSNRSVRGCARC